MLRRIFGSKRNEVTMEWRRLHNEQHYALYSSLNIIRVIKSRRIKWAGHVACVEVGDLHTGFWWEDLKGGNHFEDPGVDGSIISKWIFEK